MYVFFSSTPIPGCPSPIPNAILGAGAIDRTFISCLASLQDFPLDPLGQPDTNQAGNYACSGPGIPSTNIFGLIVPRRFVAPNTQQWNLTIQRELGRSWVFEVGHVGADSVHGRVPRGCVRRV